VLASLAWWAPDMFRRYVAGSIPPIQSERIGDQVLDEILALQAGDCSSTAGAPAAKALLSRLFTPETHWKLVILPLNERPTAALPGGHLLVSSALLAGLHEPDELAGYIALEAAHADSAPLLAELLQGAGLGATWRLMMTGQLDPQAAGSAAAEVLQGSAIPGPGNDARALQILQRAGIGGRPFAAALLRQGADAGRAATYDQTGTEGATPALADQDWVALQDICAG
jgi:hypothetical protein